MASLSDNRSDNEQRTEQGKASSRSNQPLQPPSGGQVPAMGYPAPSTGYGAYVYGQPPPGAYYNPQFLYESQQRGFMGSTRFLRGIIIGIVFFLILFCATSIIFWLVLRPQVPSFHVDSLSLSNFNVSSSGFEATWDANVTVRNTNSKLKVFFDRIEIFLYYNDDNLLALSAGNPFFLDTKKSHVMQEKLSANYLGNNAFGTGSSVGSQMAMDTKNGALSFDLRMVMRSTFRSGSWWTRHTTLRVFCEHLKVAFSPPSSTTANLLAADGGPCLVLL